MKESILIAIFILTVAINVSSIAICEKLDRLIELNTPEIVKVIPEKILLEVK